MAALPDLLSRTGDVVRRLFQRILAQEPGSVVVCPRDRMPAAVTLDPGRRLLDCSRRETGTACPQDCIPQLQYCDEDLPTFLERNAGVFCSQCSTPIGAHDWYASRIAALRPRSAPASVGAAPAHGPTCFQCCTAGDPLTEP